MLPEGEDVEGAVLGIQPGLAAVCSLLGKTWVWRAGFPLDMGAAGADQDEMSQEMPMRSFTGGLTLFLSSHFPVLVKTTFNFQVLQHINNV